MLRGMTATDFELWKAYLALAPQGPERDDIRTASICQAIYNVQIEKAAGRGRRPRLRALTDFLLLFGDAPDLTAPKRKQTAKERWEALKAMFLGSGAKPIQPQQ